MSIETEGTLHYRRDQRPRVDHDYYVEPRRAVDALLDVETFVGRTWDPACGGGNIPRALLDRDISCWGSDIVDRGWRNVLGDGEAEVFDFTRGGIAPGIPAPDNIVTNPPFALAEEFIRRSLGLTVNKVAILARLAFLEGQARGKLFAETPLARVWVFKSRISMPPGGQEIKAVGGSVAFCWLMWQHSWRGPPHLGWLP